MAPHPGRFPATRIRMLERPHGPFGGLPGMSANLPYTRPSTIRPTVDRVCAAANAAVVAGGGDRTDGRSESRAMCGWELLGDFTAGAAGVVVYAATSRVGQRRSEMQRGIVGLGRMGASMVRRLLTRGHQCVVYARAVSGSG